MDSTALNPIVPGRRNWVAMVTALAILGLMFSPFFAPLALAGIFAFAMRPVFDFFQRKCHCSVGICSVLTVLTFLLILSIPLGWLAYDLSGNLGNRNGIIEKIPEISSGKFLDRVPEMTGIRIENFRKLAQPVLAKGGGWLMGAVGRWAATLPEMAFDFLIFLVALYMFLSRQEKVRAFLLDTGWIREPALRKQIVIWRQASYSSISVNAILGTVQASLVAGGAWIFTDFSPVRIFIATFFFSFVPVFGAGSIALAMAIVAFFQGQSGDGVALLVITGITGVTDNILRPFLASSDDDSIHPLAALVALMGAITIFGFSGLFIGPVLLSAAPRIYKAATRHTTLLENSHDTALSPALA